MKNKLPEKRALIPSSFGIRYKLFRIPYFCICFGKIWYRSLSTSIGVVRKPANMDEVVAAKVFIASKESFGLF